MNNVEPNPDYESSHSRAGSEISEMSSASVWLKDLSLGAVLVLTVIGVAYTSYSRRPIVIYWDLLAPLIALVCVAAGWHRASAKRLTLLFNTHADTSLDCVHCRDECPVAVERPKDPRGQC